MFSKIVSFIMSIFMFICSLFGISLPEKSNEGLIESDKNNHSFTVSLEENGTTGYRWTYKISDESVVKLTDDKFISPAQGEKLLAGAPGTRVFTFKAASAGKATITFSYERSWEKEAIKTVTVTVEVAEDMTVTTQYA